MAPAPIATLLATPRLGTAAALLLSLPYWSSGIAKLVDLDGAIGEANHFGFQPAILVALLTILVQIGGSLPLVAGRQAWLGAGALSGFTGLETLIAHPFSTVPDPVTRFHDRTRSSNMPGRSAD